jgi:L-lactate dehydrogenase complex protein LldG
VEAHSRRAQVNAREEILSRVRAALEGADTGEVTVPRGYRSAPAPHDPVTLFCERVADYRATVVRCAEVDVLARIMEALTSATRVITPDGLSWVLPNGISDTGLTTARLDEMDAVVTEATVGVAETGTIVLTHGPGQGRRALSLVPDLHVCIVRADQVVADVPDAFRLLDPNRPTTWISGPSATSDIELDRVEGVHGPRRLHVIVID